jgi:hypothetical protein
MPRITSFQGEKKIGDLAARLYGDLPAAQLKRAQQALLEANPQLKTLRDVPAGALLVVPEIPGRKPGAAAPAAAGDAPGVELLGELAQAVTAYRRRLTAAAAAESADADATTKLLASRELRSVVDKDPELKAHADRVAAATDERRREAEALRALAGSELDALEKELAALIDRLR